MKLDDSPERIMEYECCSDKCSWRGNESATVCFKHWPERLLCPECGEVVEQVTSMNSRFHSTDPGDQSLMAKLLEKEVNKVEELRQLCTELAEALEAVTDGCKFMAISGEEPYWHVLATPTRESLDLRNAALAKYNQMVKP